jgi:hypothetical protein
MCLVAIQFREAEIGWHGRSQDAVNRVNESLAKFVSNNTYCVILSHWGSASRPSSDQRMNSRDLLPLV